MECCIATYRGRPAIDDRCGAAASARAGARARAPAATEFAMVAKVFADPAAAAVISKRGSRNWPGAADSNSDTSQLALNAEL